VSSTIGSFASGVGVTVLAAQPLQCQMDLFYRSEGDQE